MNRYRPRRAHNTLHRFKPVRAQFRLFDYRLAIFGACLILVVTAFQPKLPMFLTTGYWASAVKSGYPNAPRNCTEARARGLENIPRGSPYYAPWLDADNDGLACEPWHGSRFNRR